MSEPKIYTKNYLDAYASITVPSGTGKARLNDRDHDIQYSSSGQGTNGTQVAIVTAFQTPGAVASARKIDSILLLNHNLSDVTLQSSPDGVTFTTQVSLTGTGNDLFSITGVTGAYWRLLCSNTITANQEKMIGEFILCALLLDPGVELDSYDVSYRQMAPEIPLADGSIHRTVVKWTEARSAKYEFSGKMSYLTFAQLEGLRTLKESGAAFYWQPESTTRPQEIYYVNWTGPFRFRYVTSYKSAGYQVEFQFKEV